MVRLRNQGKDVSRINLWSPALSSSLQFPLPAIPSDHYPSFLCPATEVLLPLVIFFGFCALFLLLLVFLCRSPRWKSKLMSIGEWGSAAGKGVWVEVVCCGWLATRRLVKHRRKWGAVMLQGNAKSLGSHSPRSMSPQVPKHRPSFRARQG